MMSRVVTSVWSFQHADIRHFVPEEKKKSKWQTRGIFPEETREDFLFATTGRRTTWVRREQRIGFILWQQYQQPRVRQTNGKCAGSCFHMCYGNPSVKFARRLCPRFVFCAFTTLRRHSIRNIPPILPDHTCLKIPHLILSFQGTSIPAT